MLVIEDGHWADAPTLLLLRHLAQSARGAARVLLFATFRDTEAEVPRGARADARRPAPRPTTSCGCGWRALGRGGGRVRQRVSDDRARSADLPEIARAIFDLTGGNAFLVCELWRALVETDVIADAER